MSAPEFRSPTYLYSADEEAAVMNRDRKPIAVPYVPELDSSNASTEVVVEPVEVTRPKLWLVSRDGTTLPAPEGVSLPTSEAIAPPKPARGPGISHKRDAIADLVSLDATGRARYNSGVAVKRDADGNTIVGGKTRSLKKNFITKHELDTIEAFQDVIRGGLAQRQQDKEAAEATKLEHEREIAELAVLLGHTAAEIAAMSEEVLARRIVDDAVEKARVAAEAANVATPVTPVWIEPTPRIVVKPIVVAPPIETPVLPPEPVIKPSAPQPEVLSHVQKVARDSIRAAQPGEYNLDDQPDEVREIVLEGLRQPWGHFSTPQQGFFINQAIGRINRERARYGEELLPLLPVLGYSYVPQRKAWKERVKEVGTKVVATLGAAALVVTAFIASKPEPVEIPRQGEFVGPAFPGQTTDSIIRPSDGLWGDYIQIPEQTPPPVTANPEVNPGTQDSTSSSVTETPAPEELEAVELQMGGAGSTVWGTITEYLRANGLPTDDVTVDYAKDAVLRNMNWSEADATRLQPGTGFTIPLEVIQMLQNASRA